MKTTCFDFASAGMSRTDVQSCVRFCLLVSVTSNFGPNKTEVLLHFTLADVRGAAVLFS